MNPNFRKLSPVFSFKKFRENLSPDFASHHILEGRGPRVDVVFQQRRSRRQCDGHIQKGEMSNSVPFISRGDPTFLTSAMGPEMRLRLSVISLISMHNFLSVSYHSIFIISFIIFLSVDFITDIVSTIFLSKSSNSLSLSYQSWISSFFTSIILIIHPPISDKTYW